MKKVIRYCSLSAALVATLSVGLAGCSSKTQLVEEAKNAEIQWAKVGEKLKNLNGYKIRSVSTQKGVRVVLSSEERGVVIVDAQGRLLATAGTGDTKSVDVRRDRHVNGDEGFWISFVDESRNSVVLGYFDVETDTYRNLDWSHEWSQTMTTACLSQPEMLGNNELMLWAISEEGMAHQLLLSVTDQSVKAQAVRSAALGEDVLVCAVDDQQQKLYWSQSHIGLLSLNSDEEKDEGRRQLAAVQPVGQLAHAPSDIQVLSGVGVVSATIADSSTVHLFSLAGEPLSSLSLHGVDQDSVTSVVLSEPHQNAAVDSQSTWQWWAMTDEGNHVLSATTAPLSGLPERNVEHLPTYSVLPVVQTDIVNSYGDAADDPEVWVNSRNPEASLILATDKQQGLWVYDLQGHEKQLIPRGKLNNVDVRYGFSLGLSAAGQSQTVDLAMATNRSTNNLDLYSIDPKSGKVSFLAGNIVDDSIDEPYGGCLYQSRTTGQTYAFVNNKDGVYQQWALMANETAGAVEVHGEKVREFQVKGQPEGCVADDETGTLYVGEEDYGLWYINAEANGGVELTLMDSVDNKRLVADVEGVSLYTDKNGRGFLVVSSQGDNAYVLYDRKTHEYAGRFRVRANADLGIDGSSETDGLAVTSANLGGAFGRGLLVVQDGRNRMPSARQNFKLVPWDAVEAGLDSNSAVAGGD